MFQNPTIAVLPSSEDANASDSTVPQYFEIKVSAESDVDIDVSSPSKIVIQVPDDESDWDDRDNYKGPEIIFSNNNSTTTTTTTNNNTTNISYTNYNDFNNSSTNSSTNNNTNNNYNNYKPKNINISTSASNTTTAKPQNHVGTKIEPSSSVVSDKIYAGYDTSSFSDDQVYKMLEDEVFGRRMMGRPYYGRMITRRYNRSLVHFWNPSDEDIFDQVIRYKENGHSNIEDAFDFFLDDENTDAIVKIVYQDSSASHYKIHWDAILKYDLTSANESNESQYQQARAQFETGLLKSNLFLVRDKGPDIELVGKNKNDPGVHFIKVLAGFKFLCMEAERIQLKLELSELYKIKRMNMIQRETNAEQEQFFQSLINLNDTNQSSDTKKKKKLSDIIKPYKEGHDGTWRSIINFALVIIPEPLEVESDPFELKFIHTFKGGDKFERGMSPVKVKLDLFSTSQRSFLVETVAGRIKIYGVDNYRLMSLSRLLAMGIYKNFAPTHDGSVLTVKNQSKVAVSDEAFLPDINPFPKNSRTELFHSWVNTKNPWSILSIHQPLRKIRNYFGESIGFFYGFFGFYSVWLILPAFSGVIVTIYGLATYSYIPNSTIFDNALTLPFTFLISIWSMCFLEYWKRQSNTLATIWDTHDLSNSQEKIRSEWHGSAKRLSPITGQIERYEPSNLKIQKRFLSFIGMVLSILIVLAIELFIIFLQSMYSASPLLATAANAVLSLINIVVLSPIYMNIAEKLTVFENHKTEMGHHDSLIWKSIAFNSIINYGTLLYMGTFRTIAKVSLGSLSTATCNPATEFCLNDIMLSMLIIFLGLIFVYQINTLFIPYLFKSLRDRNLAKMIGYTSTDINLPQYLHDDVLGDWDQTSEMMNLVIQFGFITLFSCAFPLAPLLAYLTNSVEVRLSAYRLIKLSRRPFLKRSNGLGAWYIILTGMARVGVLINALVLVFSSSYIDRVILAGWQTPQKMIFRVTFVLIFSQAVFIFAYIVNRWVPDIPTNIYFALLREEYLEQVARGLEEKIDEEKLKTCKPNEEKPKMNRKKSIWPGRDMSIKKNSATRKLSIWMGGKVGGEGSAGGNGDKRMSLGNYLVPVGQQKNHD